MEAGMKRVLGVSLVAFLLLAIGALRRRYPRWKRDSKGLLFSFLSFQKLITEFKDYNSTKINIIL